MSAPPTCRAPRRLAAGQRGITLIELLMAMVIMGVISTMLLMGWFALQKSYGFTTHSADARDSGRQAIQRMQREIRDAQKPPQGYLGTSSSGAPDAIMFRARAYWIAFSSTFNDVGNASAGWVGATPTPSPSRPQLVVYRLYDNGQLWRFEDTNLNGKIDRSSGGTIDMSSEYPTDFDVAETQDGEGAALILSNVVNFTDPATGQAYLNPAKGTPIFDYNYYDENGVLRSPPSHSLYNEDRQGVVAVPLRLLVDLNPARAPVYADLRGTAQLRNAR